MPDFSRDKMTHSFTGFRVTQEEYEFIDGLAQEAELGDSKGKRKGHSVVLREAIAALKREVEREKKRKKPKDTPAQD